MTNARGRTSSPRGRRSSGGEQRPYPRHTLVDDRLSHRGSRAAPATREHARRDPRATAHLLFERPRANTLPRRPLIARRPVAPEHHRTCCAQRPHLASSLIDLPPTERSRRSSARCCTPTTVCRPPGLVAVDNKAQQRPGRRRPPAAVVVRREGVNFHAAPWLHRDQAAIWASSSLSYEERGSKSLPKAATRLEAGNYGQNHGPSVGATE
jgi:hypothetical protein